MTAVSPIAFKQAVGMLRRGGTCVLNGLPPGEFPVSIFDLVLNRYTLRGSIVGTRKETEQSQQSERQELASGGHAGPEKGDCG